ncbi:hypothetical protein GCK32_002046, partial [Trichostrongylus colubriformis]
PFLTPYCGYAYHTQGHYWSFDMTKPYTYLYWTFNTVLQITCVAVVALVDFIIIWKIYGLRRTTDVRKRNGLNSTSVPKPRISREMRLALSFLFLSVCFLLQTLLYNLPLGNGILVTILRRLTSNLNLAKWAVYSLGSAAIRHGILRVFRCHRTDSVIMVSVTMNQFTFIYTMNLILNTAIITMDILIIFVAVRTGEIRKHLVLNIIFLSMGLDILEYLNYIIHDIPSYTLDMDIFQNTEVIYVSILILCCQWFAQLFVLLALSLIHFIAIFFPSQFRTISAKSIYVVNLIIIAIGIFLSIPLLTPYCGFAYNPQGHYWSFDMSKPYTYIYKSFNNLLQIVCVVAVVLVDIIIIWKIYQLRSSSNRNTFKSTITANSRKDRRISSEMRLALNFLFLSACFLAQTLLFNFPLGSGLLSTLFSKLIAKLNLAKWAIYSFGSAAVRNGILRLLRCKRVDGVTATISVQTKT